MDPTNVGAHMLAIRSALPAVQPVRALIPATPLAETGPRDPTCQKTIPSLVYDNLIRKNFSPREMRRIRSLGEAESPIVIF